MPNKSNWTADTRPENIDIYTETSGGQTATYKLVDAHPIIGGILQKLAFFRTHAAAVWYDKISGQSVKQKLDAIDQEVEELRRGVGEVGKLHELPFLPSDGITKLFVYKSKIGILIQNFSVAANTKLPTTVHPEGYTYYIIGKLENANPFKFNTVTVVDAGTILLTSPDKILTPLPIYIYYDGTNTYLIQTYQYSNTGGIAAISVGRTTLFNS